MKLLNFAVMLVCGGLFADDLPLNEWIREFDQPQVEPSVQVHHLTFACADFKLNLTAGVAARVSVGGQVMGFFFRGDGSFSYLSRDATEAEILHHNADRVGKVAIENTAMGLRLSAPVKEVFVRARGLALPEVVGDAGDALVEAVADHQKFYESVRYRPASHLLASPPADDSQAAVAVVQIHTGKSHLIYELDMVEQKSQQLLGLFKWTGQVRGGKNKLFIPTTLSNQPVGRELKDFLEPPFLLTDVTYTLTAYKNDHADLRVTENVLPLKKNQRVLCFNQNSEYFDTNGKPRRFHVRSIEDEQGRSLAFDHRLHRLVVELAESASANRPLKLKFHIEGDFLIRPNGDSFWQLGVDYWFPQPELNGQYYTLHSTVKVEKPFVAFTPGVTLRREEEGDFHVLETRVDKPIQFAVVHAGKYRFEEKSRNGLTVRVASYAGKNRLAMKQLSNLSFQIIDVYEKFLGPFPFKEFNIIEINSYGFGQAPPGTMFITREAFNPRSDDISKLYSGGINHRFAHEIAHQYWGHVIKMGSYEEQWLTESFAEYSSCIIVEMIKGKSGLQAMVKTWKSNARGSCGVSSIPHANRILDPDDFFESQIHRRNLIYSKGAYLLHRIHEDVGDKIFFSFLNGYQKAFAWKFGTTKDVVALLNYLTDKDYGPLFERCFWGTGMPD